MTPPQFWRTAFGSSGINSWRALAGDADGDGRGDLLAVGPPGESSVSLAQTSPFGKPLPDNSAHATLGPAPIASASGLFAPSMTGVAVAVVFPDGAVKVAWGMKPGSDTFPHVEAAATIPEAHIPKAPVQTATADFNGDNLSDVMILDRDGRLLLLQQVAETGNRPRFKARPLTSNLLEVRSFAAGALTGDKGARCVWINRVGSLMSAPLLTKPDGVADLGPSKTLMKASPDDHLAVGRFRGGKVADILVGQRLLPGGDPKAVAVLKELPDLAVAKDDGVWDVADIDGNGKDDLIRHREGKERFGSHDVYIHFSYDSTEEAKGYYASGNDGLPDIWKTGKMRPGGLDLKAIGCKVGRRDVVVAIERFEDVNLDELRNHMNRAARYLASLPIPNPDGSTGVYMHVIYPPAWPLKDKDYVKSKLNELFPRTEHRGIAHMMFAENGGALFASIDGDRGYFNGHWQEFLHEFGHQLGLVHHGFRDSQTAGFYFDVGSVLYPSMMSYTFSYGINNDGEQTQYSDGARAPFVVDERKVTERLPFPIDKVRHVGAGPYYFRIKPSDDGKGTLVDWNWNGILGEESVSADLNYSHGVDTGNFHLFSKTKNAPILVAHGDGADARPLLVYGDGIRLAVRTWLGKDRDTEGNRWSAEVADGAAGMNGDASAAYLGNGVTWVAYPTIRGTMLRKITVDGGGRPVLGEATLLPRTAGAFPTVAALGDRLALLLWRSKVTPVELSVLRPTATGLTMGAERPLDIRSDMPVGATAGPVNGPEASIWVGRIQSDGQEHQGRTEVIRYAVGSNGDAKPAYRTWADGRYARYRMTLLWRPEPGNLPEGRLYLMSGGLDPAGPSRQQWIAMNVPYPEMAGGWLVRRYRQDTFKSAFAPGACFLGDNIVYAVRFDNDDLNVAFYGSGANTSPLGDFDDIGHIRDFGLSRSIRGFVK
ncbi:MAG: hypothetical protein ACO1SV_02675 [Fimbriimonas sp.]